MRIFFHLAPARPPEAPPEQFIIPAISASEFFVTRAKSNTKFKRRYSHPVDRAGTSVLCDQTGVLSSHLAAKDYPTTMRRVVVKDDIGKRLVFLTNNFTLKPELIADLYRQRWQVELFFKWIKQHLRIKVFFGTSENAVKTQISIRNPDVSSAHRIDSRQQSNS